MRYPATGKRLFGIAVPIGSIRVEGGWRVGEYPDLEPFGRLCGRLGAGLVQILPVNDTGSQSSPYSALSAHALHPLYVRVGALPEAKAAPAAVKALESFAAEARPGERFPYGACFDAKLAALRAVYAASKASIAIDPALASFVAERPWVKTYAVYKRLKSSFGEKAWREWPDHREPTAADIDALWLEPEAREEQLFQAWVQMRAAEQFGAASKALAGMGIALLGDIPILMNDDSADVWANRKFFDASMKAGAPPDMYSATGQNWGFPIYDWDEMEKDGYSFWKGRVAEADRYYSAFRIDHVLGFFRIWALGSREETGSLGRFVPGFTVSEAELASAGFGRDRIRWLSEPHVSGADLRAAAASPAEAARAVDSAMDRIGDEDLFLFKREVRGEADISSLGLGAGLSDYLKGRWRDRALLAAGNGRYAPTWTYRDTTAWRSLSDGESSTLGSMIERGSAEAELGWESRGRALLSMLKAASGMLPCAEDLGAVPDCVPRVLAELGMPGLRVPRWMRYWDKPEQPYKPLSSYPIMSACTPSVHDTSTMREWWEMEADREAFLSAYCPSLSPPPTRLDPESVLTLLSSLAKAPSALFVIQIQDALDASSEFRSKDPAADRINVPGTVGDSNWTWRMGTGVGALESAKAWIDGVRGACAR